MAPPLDAERERLRALGYTDDEIRQILIARELTPPAQPAAGGAAGPQQPFSGPLNNVGATLSHARGVLPAIQSEVSTLRNSAAPPSRRLLALGAVFVILAVIGVFGYGASLELSVLQSQATKSAADARVAGEIAQAQAAKAKADACISRVESDAKNQKMGDVLSGKYHADELDECDPDYAAKKACSDRFAAIFAPLDQFSFHDPRVKQFSDELNGKLKAFKADCELTDSEKKLAIDKFMFLNTHILGLPANANMPQARTSEDSAPPPAPTPLSPPAPVSAPQPAPSSPPASASPDTTASIEPVPQRTLRTPTNFDCEHGKHMGADWVICASPELKDMEAQLEDAYSAAKAARGDSVRHEQFTWMKQHATDCGLPLHGPPPDERIMGARDCVMAYMKERLAELQTEQ